jgi:hypothetical protein
LAQIDRTDRVEHDFGIESFGMRLKPGHQFRAHDAIDIGRPVIDFGGGHQLTALLQAGDQTGFRLARAA